ncbi:hypothetical protein L2E82_07721 [Cichorium intybus]|uniref:Uncharacterized protein n=1 Tax=Cichorium intybus TaxID=13427 RepID=A0ACB9G4A6_CICIN|nr:hypothetical protein L2E82_07721 [Cichorium intybus]
MFPINNIIPVDDILAWGGLDKSQGFGIYLVPLNMHPLAPQKAKKTQREPPSKSSQYRRVTFNRRTCIFSFNFGSFLKYRGFPYDAMMNYQTTSRMTRMDPLSRLLGRIHQQKRLVEAIYRLGACFMGACHWFPIHLVVSVSHRSSYSVQSTLIIILITWYTPSNFDREAIDPDIIPEFEQPLLKITDSEKRLEYFTKWDFLDDSSRMCLAMKLHGFEDNDGFGVEIWQVKLEKKSGT